MTMALRGHLDEASGQRLRGWAVDEGSLDSPVALVVTTGSTILGRVLANTYRKDLADAGIASGRCAFEFDLSNLVSPLDDTIVAVKTERNDEHLSGSPILVARSTAFEDVGRKFAESVLSYETDCDLHARLGFLASQSEALLAVADFRRSGQAEREARRKLRWLRPDAADLLAPLPADKKRALVIEARVPSSARDAGSHAILAHIRSLQRLGYAVTFVPMDLGPSSPDLVESGVVVMTRPWYASVEEVLARNANAFGLVYLHRADIAAVYGALVRKHQPQARILYSVADLGSLRLERQAIALEHPDLLPASRNEDSKERIAAFFADAIVTHSTVEASILARRHPDRMVQVVPFAVPAMPVERPMTERHGFAFVGSFDHQPNLDAAFRLIDDVMPALALIDPTIPCIIAGSGMPRHLMAKSGGNLRILGGVPDIAAIYDMVRLTCAPLAFGAGVKGKVIESFAAGIPCVCTTIAAEGLDLPDELQAFVADRPLDLAALIARLHEDKDLNATVAMSGRRFVADYASEDAIDTAMEVAVGETARRTLDPAAVTT